LELAALEMSIMDDEVEENKYQPRIIPREELLNRPINFYEREVEIRDERGQRNDNWNVIDIRDYDVDNNLDILLAQSQSAFRRDSNRMRNQEQNINVLNPKQQRRRENGNDLLSEIPGVVRERIMNPFANVRAEAANLRPQFIRRIDRNPRPRNQQMEVDIDNMSYDQLLEFENNLGNVSKGYKKEDIENIPIMFTFTHNKKAEENCPICLEDIISWTPQLSIACRHQFHISCIKKSLENNKECPVCKAEAICLD
jgi:hypothetical protein